MAEVAPPRPAVSVIIIFFNEEKYLEQAIQSVIDQTCTGWELILVDDGSSDASTQIAKDYAQRYPDKIRALEHPNHENRGMSATRNLGLEHARGDHIAMLDGDDVWLADKLEKQLGILDRHPEAAMTFGPLLEWHAWAPGGGEDRLYCVAGNGRHPFADTLVPPPDMLALFLKDETFIPSGALFRHDAFKGVGGFENQFPASYEDAVFHVKMCARYPVFVHGDAYYKYRIHPESCERQISPAQLAEKKLAFFEWAQAYLNEQGVTDPRVTSACRKAISSCRYPLRYGIVRRLKHLLGKIDQAVIKVGRLVLPRALRDWLWSIRAR